MAKSRWTPERDALLKQLRADGVKVETVAVQLGISVSTVSDRIATLGIATKRARAKFWNDERDDALRGYWAEELKLSEICAKFDNKIGESSVSFRASRLGLPKRTNGNVGNPGVPRVKDDPPPAPAGPRYTNPVIVGCPYIEARGDGSRCGEGEGGYCGKHRSRILPIPRPMNTHMGTSLAGGRISARFAA